MMACLTRAGAKPSRRLLCCGRGDGDRRGAYRARASEKGGGPSPKSLEFLEACLSPRWARSTRRCCGRRSGARKAVRSADKSRGGFAITGTASTRSTYEKGLGSLPSAVDYPWRSPTDHSRLSSAIDDPARIGRSETSGLKHRSKAGRDPKPSIGVCSHHRANLTPAG